MRSMTGFGQARGENARHALSVTLRSVNHRYLELRLHLADEQQASEAELRQLLTAELERGRVEVGVEIRPTGPRRARVRVEREVVMAAHSALEELLEGGLIAERLTAGDLLRVPEALVVEPLPERWDDDDRRLLRQVAARALAELVAARRTEGEAIQAVLAERLAELAAVAQRLAELRLGVREEIAAALAARVEELLDGRTLDEARLAQEVALLAERSDVAEELDRLSSHVEHFRELLERTGAVGKRLDFLAQELFRELNTLGAKARDAAMTRAVLDGKELVEQLREQVQNVE